MVGTVLIVVAHPDDECFMGAVIARLCAEGYRVVVTPLANGETSRRGASDGAVERRIERAGRCADTLGHALCIPQPLWPDQRLDTVPLLDLTRAIEEVIVGLKPSIVYTHSPGDLNSDHRRVYEAVLPAVRPKSGVQNIYTFAGPRMMRFEPTAFWQVTTVDVDKQRAAMTCYGDELDVEWELLNARAVVYGYHVGVPLAAGFEVVRECR